MAEILDHADAAKALPKILSRIDAIKAELKELETKKSNQPPISDLHNSELERDIAYNVAEIDVLKSSVPEGQMEDENVQYFIAVAEIQKSNEVLRQQLQFSTKNLDSLNSDISGTQELLKSLVEINKELSASKKKREEERKKTEAYNNALTSDERKNAKIKKIKEELQAIGAKKRGTIKVYQEFKKFLQQFLIKITPNENEDGDSELAMLLQHLWNQFFNEGPLVYTDISSLAFDVAEEDIATLDDNFIIERNAENKNEIRMVDFTH